MGTIVERAITAGLLSLEPEGFGSSPAEVVADSKVLAGKGRLVELGEAEPLELELRSDTSVASTALAKQPEYPSKYSI